jgi:hypothetical protein
MEKKKENVTDRGTIEKGSSRIINVKVYSKNGKENAGSC